MVASKVLRGLFFGQMHSYRARFKLETGEALVNFGPKLTPKARECVRVRIASHVLLVGQISARLALEK